MITVSRDIGLKAVYGGSTQLVSGEIAEDLTAYMSKASRYRPPVGLEFWSTPILASNPPAASSCSSCPALRMRLDKLEEDITVMDAPD